jgi:hypothetical protein
MPTMPPSIEVYSTAEMKQMTDSLRAGMILTADYIANQCVAMHPRIVATLVAEGLDGSNRFGFGSTASAAASAIIRPGQRAAQQLTAAATLITAMNRAWHVHLVTPVEAARAAAKAGGRKVMNV